MLRWTLTVIWIYCLYLSFPAGAIICHSELSTDSSVSAGLTEMLATKTQFKLIPISIISEPRTRHLPKVGDLESRPWLWLSCWSREWKAAMWLATNRTQGLKLVYFAKGPKWHVDPQIHCVHWNPSLGVGVASSQQCCSSPVYLSGVPPWCKSPMFPIIAFDVWVILNHILFLQTTSLCESVFLSGPCQSRVTVTLIWSILSPLLNSLYIRIVPIRWMALNSNIYIFQWPVTTWFFFLKKKVLV